MPEKKEHVLNGYFGRYGFPASFLSRAPGRVNLIGEHTDYNDGFVLPMAIDRHAWIAFTPRQDKLVRVYALDYGEESEFSLAALQKGGPVWAEYIKGVAWAMQENGYEVRGWQGVLGGDVPSGAGLSSSAAVELAAARTFSQSSGVEWEAVHMAKLAQRAENDWVGVNCGIMDQMISAVGIENHAILIDCRSLEFQPAPLSPGCIVVVMDTGTRRGLVDSAYNERRVQCEAAAAYFKVSALRDVSPEEFEARAAGLEAVTRRRARHVIYENKRTLEARERMQAGDAAGFGRLMNASHTSLRDDFEVSSPELDLMTNLAQAHSGCYGARMTGAGFGGCAVALVHLDAVMGFVEEINTAYRSVTHKTPQLTICRAVTGADIVEL